MHWKCFLIFFLVFFFGRGRGGGVGCLFFIKEKTSILNFLLWTFFMHDKKVHSSPAWTSWATVAVVFFLTGLHNGFWIIKNFLLLRLSAFFQSGSLLACVLFGFFLWTTARMDLNVASCLFYFPFLIYFGLALKNNPEGPQAGEEWVSMATGMLLDAQGFHGHVPTNYNSKAPVEHFKTVSSFMDCLLNASPIFSPCFAPYK